MGYSVGSISAPTVKKSIWESGLEISYQKYDCDSGTETTVIKNTIDLTDIDYLHYYYVLTDYANNYDLKIKFNGTAEITDNVVNNHSAYGTIDVTAYTGYVIISVTLQRTGGAGTVGVLSEIHFNSLEA